MAEQTSTQQLLTHEAEILIDEIRNSLCDQNPTLPSLVDSIQALAAFKKATNGVEAGSFCSIVDRLEIVFERNLKAQTIPNRIELETVALAVDWLAQLAIFYKENLPEPKALVTELLYAFDLVEFSQDAESVADRAENDKAPDVDPFSGDPEFDVTAGQNRLHYDPFDDDPGLGLEFDLLQRTINFVAEKKKIIVDPFGVDPPLSTD